MGSPGLRGHALVPGPGTAVGLHPLWQGLQQQRRWIEVDGTTMKVDHDPRETIRFSHLSVCLL
jgi:hypothetical protein